MCEDFEFWANYYLNYDGVIPKEAFKKYYTGDDDKHAMMQMSLWKIDLNEDDRREIITLIRGDGRDIDTRFASFVDLLSVKDLNDIGW